LESLQALRPKVAAHIHKQTHNMFLVILRPFMNARLCVGDDDVGRIILSAKKFVHAYVNSRS
jgi:hypothetical protein